MDNISRRRFLALSAITSASIAGTSASGVALSQPRATPMRTGKPLNILMLVTDQERYMALRDMPPGYNLPAHQRLAREGVVFENHQIASNVCTPSRAVIYTGQHIQNNGMFDNTNFPWSNDLSTEIDTLGDMLRREGYYTAYKGKWHLNDDFETINDIHAPRQLLADEMEEYGFSDYFGIGDIIAHTEGGYLHDDVISAMSRSWLRGRGEQLRRDDKPWFMAVNLVNPHDVMYYNTDLPDQNEQTKRAMMRLNREPSAAVYQNNWPLGLPASRNQSLMEPGRPAAHLEYRESRGALVGVVPNVDDRWRRLNNYYMNCIRDVDQNVSEILLELDNLGIADNTIVIYTADHGELAGAHGLSGKGATAYREQNNVPFIIRHPHYPGNKKCSAVTSHVDIATTLLSMAGAKPTHSEVLPGKDISTLLAAPEAADFDSLRPGTLFNYNMFAYLDAEFLNSVADFFAAGGKPADIAKQGFRPNLSKRGAIRSVFDGKYKFSRYFSPQQHHVPRTLEHLYGGNDLELFDLSVDPLEMTNLAFDRKANGDIMLAMNDKLNLLIEQEVGEDIGQMLPGGVDGNWALSPDIAHLRM